MSLFRAYMRSWVLDDPRDLEKVLESVSEEEDLHVQAVQVRIAGEDHFIFAPHFHFGPFGKAGSSTFPSLLKRTLYGTSAVKGVVVHTPSTHSQDLPTREECLKIIKMLSKTKASEPLSQTITPLIQRTHGRAQASALAFTDTILLCLSYEEMEDIPPSVSSRLAEKALEAGFREAIVVDAHNSLKGASMEYGVEELEELFSAGTLCLQDAKREVQRSFEASFTSICPSDIGVKEGLGTGGVSAFVWRVGGKTYALVVLDANNLFPELRWKIVEELRNRLGFEVEVVTTDTHEVTAMGMSSRGYVVLGEKGDWVAILSSVISACELASNKLATSEIGCTERTIPSKTLGEKGLALLSSTTDEAYRRTKLYAPPAYGAALLLSLLIL